MKTIGIIGGLGPPSTLKYYEWLNDGVQKALGGVASANIILTSVNVLDVAAFRNAKDDTGEGAFFARHAELLENAGADFILIASNTSHRNAPYVEAAVKIPLLHLADATAQKIVDANVTKVALLGTPYTMEHDFYKSRFAERGIDVLVPNTEDRAWMGRAIYDELFKGIVMEDARAKFAQVAEGLLEQGAQGVVLGCTELTLLNLHEICTALNFDTTRIHVEAAVAMALG